MTKLRDRIPEDRIGKLKNDFLEVAKTCPRTTVREEPGCAASALRHLLHERGWHEIQTDDDVAELAELCGFSASAYATGGRSGHGKLIVIRCDGRRIGRQQPPPSADCNRQAEKRFGFSVGTKKNIAAAMYLSGATTDEVRKEVGDPKLNLLKEVEKIGFEVQKVKVVNEKGRLVTKYTILT